jgi:hypothetical protein
MLLFRSEEHLARWLQARGLPRGGTMTLDQCNRLGRIWYHDKAQPEWRRKTPGEAMATLAEIGLFGEFWDLSRPKTP